MTARAIRIASILLVTIAAIAFGWLAVIALVSEPDKTAPLVVDQDDEIQEDIVVQGRSVEIVGRVRGGVLALGGNISVTGRVDGDVAAIGGSVFQSEESHVTGDVLVVGGEYAVPSERCRDTHKDTVLFSGSEQWLRDFFANPTRELIVPRMDRSFFGWRIAAAFLSFVLALTVVAIAPAQISRASERLAADSVKIAAIGLVGTLAGVMVVSLTLISLPPPLSAAISGIVLVGLLVVHLFGRVVAYFLLGRWLQRRMLGARSRSQTVALFLGVLALAVVGSLPVVGALFIFATFILSIGIILTMPGSGTVAGSR